MRTKVPYVVLLALALGAPAAARAEGPASVHVSSCQTGSDPSQRSATYKAWMHAVPGTVRMAMRYQLVARSGGQRAQQLSSPKLSRWHRSNKGVTRFGYAQTVKQLNAGTSYRSLVKFRWYDSSGNVVLRKKRLSGACVQTGPLPNLVVSAVSVLPGSTPGTAQYKVSIENTGDGTAEGFTTALFVDGGLADSRTLERLDPGESETIDFNGPACKNRFRAVVDSGHAVAETSEDDNVLRSRC